MGILARPGFRLAYEVGNTDLSLTAGAGESLLVTGLYVYNPSGNYVTVTIEKTTVGYFRVGGTQGNHLFFPTDANEADNLLSWLYRNGLHSGYPVAEGETIEVTGAAQAGAVQLATYLMGAAGDYGQDAVNGSKASEYEYIGYGRVSGGAGDGDNLYDTSQTPTEFPDFPYGALAPQGKVMHLLGIGLSDYDNTTGTQANQQETSYLKAIQERERLWVETEGGLFCQGEASTSADESSVADDQSILGNLSDADLSEPLVFGTPPAFESNEELNLYINTNLVAGSANFSAGDAEVALLFNVTEGGR